MVVLCNTVFFCMADDPLTVVARAEETLLFAELPFETTGTNASGPLQTDWVVFTDGLQKVGVDEFIVWYGAGDTNVAGARIKVTVPKPHLKTDDVAGPPRHRRSSAKQPDRSVAAVQ